MCSYAFIFINKTLRTTKCKNSTHFPCVVYGQTMYRTAREKRTLQFMRDGHVLLPGFIRGLEKYGKVWNKIWSISRLEKAGKKFFFGLLVWKKKLFFQT